MRREDFDVDRMLGIGGQQPTARERWRAFYRLYRLARRQDSEHGMSADLLSCFSVLGFGDWASLAGGRQAVDPKSLPLFIRRQVVRTTRRRRLYGQNYENWERMRPMEQRAARRAASIGIEVTPDQVADVRYKLLRSARKVAAEVGVTVPSDDVDLLRYITASMNR